MYPLNIFTNAIVSKAIIDDYEYLKWDLKYRKVDNFELKINRYKTNVDQLTLGSIIAIKKGDTWRAGFIENKELALTEEGKVSESWLITGRGLDKLLAERLALYVTDSGTGYDEQHDIAETIMRHYVDVNCISSSDTQRNYSLLQLETDSLRGASVYCSARFQPLDEVLEGICLASGLGWNVILDTNNTKFKFRILQGLDRSWENGVNSVVIFSPEFGNIKLLGYKITKAGTKNVAYVGGQGEANLRTVQKVTYDGGTFTDTDRREFFVDARDSDTTDKLTQRGNERLEEMGVEEIMEFENSILGPFLFETDFNLGDIVTVVYPGISTMDTRIIEVVEEISPEQLISNKLIVGSQYPDLITFLQERQKNLNPEVRR